MIRRDTVNTAVVRGDTLLLTRFVEMDVPFLSGLVVVIRFGMVPGVLLP